MRRRILLIPLALALAVSLPAQATCVLKADTADTSFDLGPFVDDTDFKTLETALTITSSEVLLKKKGSTSFSAKSDATACTHRSNGFYTCPLGAGDVDTEGNMTVQVSEAGALLVWKECFVEGADFYDLHDGTDPLLNARQLGNPLSTTIDGAPTSQTVFDTVAGPSNDDAYLYQTVHIVDSGGAGECEQTITDYAQLNKRFTIEGACPFTIGAGDEVYVNTGPSGRAVENISTDISNLNDLSAGQVNAEVDDALDDAGIVFVRGTADSGTATTLVDATQSQANDYFNNSTALVVQFSAGPEVRCVRDFDSSTGTFAVYPAFSQAVGTEAYTLLAAPTCRNYP